MIGTVSGLAFAIGLGCRRCFLSAIAARDYSGAPSPLRPAELNLEKMERQFVRLALQQTRGNVTEAAKLLGLSRRTLHRKLKTYGIDAP